MTTIHHCSILEFGWGASNQAVAPGITRPLHASAGNITIFVFIICLKQIFLGTAKFGAPQQN